MTSGDLYCLVWMIWAKWWYVQQPFPRSAIFSLKLSSSFGPLKAYPLSKKVYFCLKSVVKFFSLNGGYGFIVDDKTGTDVFVHSNNLKECDLNEFFKLSKFSSSNFTSCTLISGWFS